MTFEGKTFCSLQEAREAMLGTADSFKYYNPKTGRPIKTKNAKNYKEIVLYSYNDHFGYKGMVLIKQVSNGRQVTREVFDQSGESTFNDLWEVLIYQH